MNQQFKDVVQRSDFVILDTETTGIERPAEIVQIAIIDCNGMELLNTLVKPKLSIPPAATAIHGITDKMVEDCLTWPDVREWVLRFIKDRDVIVYNAIYDRKLMHWSDEAWGNDHVDYKERSTWYCAMEAYAQHYGERHPYYGTYKWQSLSNAMLQQGLEVSDAHSALGDCLMTLELIRHCCK